ncbi:hypothetical protein [Roseixanthobacter glucoisosaccharinicivorans]|uniref:hypothetical protein n=1 Tax=Roseixanthobacter glucoisosaccharinicivorans TaxID=3119923 RepID=UPI0037294C85
MANRFEFIDFGCGNGGSYNFAASCVQGSGFAIDKSEEAVVKCQTLGIQAERHDVLSFQQRNVASGSFAINLLQEMPGFPDFRAALVNIIRASTHFSLIQHPYYDKDTQLALKGIYIPEHFDKKILLKPTISDYLSFFFLHREALTLSGIGIFVQGQTETTNLPGVLDPRSNSDVEKTTPKTLRVIIGRKDLSRFRRALYQVEAGKPAYLWEMT